MDEALEKELTQHEWTSVRHFATKNGTIKLLLHRLVDEGFKHQIKFDQENRQAMIIECSKKAEWLRSKKIEVPSHEDLL